MDAAGAVAQAVSSITINPTLSAAGNACSKFCNVEQFCSICGVFGSQSGGTAPYQYNLSGTLPPGTSLNGLSLVGGFPTVFSNPNGTSFTVTVMDALGASANPVNGVFQVFPHISIANATFNAKVGTAFTWRMAYSGGVGTPTIDQPAGMPPGTALSVSPPVVIISMPAQRLAGNYKFVLTLTDQAVCGPGAGQLCSTQATVVITVA